MKPTWASPRGFTRKVAALAQPVDIGPKALRAHNVRLVVGALVAIGLALLDTSVIAEVFDDAAKRSLAAGAAGFLVFGCL